MARGRISSPGIHEIFPSVSLQDDVTDPNLGWLYRVLPQPVC
jgi:hypothetical protein